MAQNVYAILSRETKRGWANQLWVDKKRPEKAQIIEKVSKVEKDFRLIYFTSDSQATVDILP